MIKHGRWLILAVLFLLAACSTTSPPLGSVTLTLTPSQATLRPGETREFTALVSGTPDTDVPWSATGGTVTGTGNTVTYTAPAEEGSYTLTATSRADTSKQATATIAVSSTPAEISVSLEPEDLPPPFEARIPELEAFIAAQGVPITHGGDRAFYSPSRNAIVVPHPGNFSSPEAYYAVVLHELAHASGHPSRLNRPGGPRGTPLYYFEELCAELTAAMLCAEFGLPECSHHAAYLGHYALLLESDPKAIFNASRQASQAAAFLGEQAQPTLAATA